MNVEIRVKALILRGVRGLTLVDVVTDFGGKVILLSVDKEVVKKGHLIKRSTRFHVEPCFHRGFVGEHGVGFVLVAVMHRGEMVNQPFGEIGWVALASHPGLFGIKGGLTAGENQLFVLLLKLANQLELFVIGALATIARCGEIDLMID